MAESEEDGTPTQPQLDLEAVANRIQAWVTSILERMSQAYEERFARQDDILEQFEKNLALLSIAYGESAVLVETLVSMHINKNPEDREEWMRTLTEARKHMMETFQHAAQTAEQSTDRFVAHDTDPHGSVEDPAGTQPD
jgi:hypothetical protein